MPENLPEYLPANCSIMLGEVMAEEADPCQNIKDRYNRSGKYHIIPANYFPEEPFADDETNKNETAPSESAAE
jgi:hypothetical protein